MIADDKQPSIHFTPAGYLSFNGKMWMNVFESTICTNEIICLQNRHTCNIHAHCTKTEESREVMTEKFMQYTFAPGFESSRRACGVTIRFSIFYSQCLRLSLSLSYTRFSFAIVCFAMYTKICHVFELFYHKTIPWHTEPKTPNIHFALAKFFSMTQRNENDVEK